MVKMESGLRVKATGFLLRIMFSILNRCTKHSGQAVFLKVLNPVTWDKGD